MWGEQNQQSWWHVVFLFTWRGSERVHVLETDITSHHLIPRMHTCRNVGDTCKRFNFFFFLGCFLFFLQCCPPSTAARGTSRWHCAAVCETSPSDAAPLLFCVLSDWIHCCVLRGIWMPHFTLLLAPPLFSFFFRYFCFSQPIVL